MDHYQDTPNSYRVCSNFPDIHSWTGFPEYVTFTTERQDLPLPSPKYLEVHATCCRVAHKSGAAAYYHDMDDDAAFMAGLQTSGPGGFDALAASRVPLLGTMELGSVATVSG